jgi:hypothetical protein
MSELKTINQINLVEMSKDNLEWGAMIQTILRDDGVWFRASEVQEFLKNYGALSDFIGKFDPTDRQLLDIDESGELHWFISQSAFTELLLWRLTIIMA